MNRTSLLQQQPGIEPDEWIDPVLAGLRDTPVAPDFEHRTLSALRQRLAAHPAPARWPGRKAWAWLPPLAAAAACALLAFAVLRHAPSTHTPHGLAASTGSREQRTTPETSRIASTETPSAMPFTPKHHPERSPAGAQPPRLPLEPKDPRSSPALAMIPGARDQAAALTTLAATEAAAPSQPPPPLPITAEEKQIRRFTQRHNAYHLAALDPYSESTHERAEREEFQRFFAPPPEPSGNLPLPPLESATGEPTPAALGSDTPRDNLP